MSLTKEHKRLQEYRNRESNWKHWGPYLSDRAWGTVREDYSPDGTAWENFPHDHARSRVYRWNEDGLAGISDRFQSICFSIALWNGKDQILKERLFGLTGNEGNHGEDVKEYYFYLDSSPTHSYLKMLYKYPQSAFPYRDLVDTNRSRSAAEFEYELLDTGIFDDDRYFDVYIEYAKADSDDILIRVEAVNRGPEEAMLVILPQLWFRNTWRWGYPDGPMGEASEKPHLQKIKSPDESSFIVEANHPSIGDYYLYADRPTELIFTENESNHQILFGRENDSPFTKDAFHRYIIDGELGAVNSQGTGTKVGVFYTQSIPAGGSEVVRLRLSHQEKNTPFKNFQQLVETRIQETDEFYNSIQQNTCTPEELSIQRQAFAGLLWTKQFYYYDINQWLKGDPAFPPPPKSRLTGRNHKWQHITNYDIVSMPDKWEYPWYATWDSSFHVIPLALIDPDFAKRQLVLFTREWYMHPNGQLPAYEWSFDDVNPPVHAWAAWRVYKIDARINDKPDRDFLEGIFHKLLINFTWWTNRKDSDDNNIFQGGFLGLDNISVFDRSGQLPGGGHIDQADGTAWMAFYSLTMLKIALELSKDNRVYEDTASKFFEHFLAIANSMTNLGGQGFSLWDEEDGFFYDAIHLPDGSIQKLKVRSIVGLLPLIAVETLESEIIENMPDFYRRLCWFIENRPGQAGNMASVYRPGSGLRRLLSVLTKERLEQVLKFMLDENEFLSPYGVRSLSKFHEENPFEIEINGQLHRVPYWPAESQNNLFGGNSNWRGPVWFPINFLIIEALQRFHHYYGDDLLIEYPTGSGNKMNLWDIARDISRRLESLFQIDQDGNRPIYGSIEKFQIDPHWKDHILFYEYFHGDNGAGLGASHQTGWTALIAKLIQQSGGKL